jgi:DNA-binding XRE family transcriptional regulator
MSTQGPTEAWTWRETPESNSAVMVTGNQIRAARMLAGLTQKALAAEAGIAMQTLNHMEAAGHAPALGHKNSQARVLAALGAQGIMLVPKGAVLVS